MIFSHQKEVYDELFDTIDTFFHGEWKNLPIRPRFNRFITGPTGTGKTTIVREVANNTGYPLFEFSASDWLPLGISERASGRSTWLEVAHFCLSNEKGIIFLDEVDKLGEQSAWMNHLRVEIFSLLDKKVPPHLRIKSFDSDDKSDSEEEIALRRIEVQKRLENQFIIIGGGAFQSLWRVRHRSVCGFVAQDVFSQPSLTLQEMHQMIPEEIANRFAPPILQLNPLKESDYRQMAIHVAESLPSQMASLFDKLVEESISSALKNQSGCRWVEELVLKTVMINHKINPPKLDKMNDLEEDSFPVSSDRYEDCFPDFDFSELDWLFNSDGDSD